MYTLLESRVRMHTHTFAYIHTEATVCNRVMAKEYVRSSIHNSINCLEGKLPG